MEAVRGSHGQRVRTSQTSCSTLDAFCSVRLTESLICLARRAQEEPGGKESVLPHAFPAGTDETAVLPAGIAPGGGETVTLAAHHSVD